MAARGSSSVVRKHAGWTFSVEGPSRQATLLITSHDRHFLTAVANRFLLIEDGRLVDPMDFNEVFLTFGGAGLVGQLLPA